MKFIERLIDKAVEKYLKVKLLTTKVARDTDLLLVTIDDKDHVATREEIHYFRKALEKYLPDTKTLVTNHLVKIKPCKRKKKCLK